jgi:hypothetical protein
MMWVDNIKERILDWKIRMEIMWDNFYYTYIISTL